MQVGRMAAPLQVKAAGTADGLDEGQFVGYASVFGNVDAYGDIVQKGAFTRTLGEWADGDAVIPVLWGHDMADPFLNVGTVSSAEEDDTGLKITAQLDLDNPKAAQVYKLVKGRRTNTMSFAYSVRDSSTSEDGNHLTDLDLYEVSVVQVPANEAAEITAVKAGHVKAGRSLSAKNERSLREARDALDAVLASLDAEDGKHRGGFGAPERVLLDPADYAAMFGGSKAAIPASTGPSGTTSQAWDGPANEARLSTDAGAETYRQAYAWVDPDGDPDAKAAYKFIHHQISEDGTVGAANTQACTTGIGVLNGGRGGSNVPEDDRQAVYNHLARHLRDADIEPPELSSASAPDDEGGDQEKASGYGPANAEGPRRVNAQEPSRSSSAKTLAAQVAIANLEGP